MVQAGFGPDQGGSMATILSRRSSFNYNIDGSAVPTDQTLPSDADVSVSEQITKELVRWFKLLADETRLKILIFLLERGELNVRALCDLLQLSQPAVSHHLALLRVDGLIDCRRDGKHNFYRVLPERLSELMGIVFSRQPGREPQLRFGQCVLIYQRADGERA
jgi:ArsR family transcriptional regulator, arsenate/arsenite/antimonite-responsive transcriptional repressor